MRESLAPRGQMRLQRQRQISRRSRPIRQEQNRFRATQARVGDFRLANVRMLAARNENRRTRVRCDFLLFRGDVAGEVDLALYSCATCMRQLSIIISRRGCRSRDLEKGFMILVAVLAMPSTTNS